MNGFKTIFLKEVLDNARDRRTLITLAASIIIGPLLMFGLFWFIEQKVKDETDSVSAKPTELAVVGAELAPNLMSWLRQNNIEIKAAPEDPEQAIRNGDERIVLVIEDDFVEAFRSGDPAPLKLIRDSSEAQLKAIGFEKVRGALRGYGQRIGALRLQARGINPQVGQPIAVNVSDVATPEARGAEMLLMVPYMVVIFIMVGGMYLAIDTTAGEREQGSLEPLLAQPVSRRSVVLAKLAATCLYSAITLLLVLIGLAVAFRYLPIESLNVSVGVAKVLKIFFACLPFVVLGGGLMVLVASFTKSYKEAQSYLGMVMIAPSLPLIIVGFLAPTPEVSNMWVPSLSQGLIIMETMKGEVVPWSLIGLSMIVSLALGLALAWVAVKLYERERILG